MENPFDKLLKDFNETFSGDAKGKIVEDELHITVGSRTMVIQLMTMIGAQAVGE